MCCYIPSELLWQILVRLPAKSLFRLRSVCKNTSSKPTPTLINSTQTTSSLEIKNLETQCILSLFDSLNFNSGPQMIDATLIKYSHLPEPQLFDAKLFSVAFCNGLILIPSKKDWAIFNPLTKECHKMCQPPNANVDLTVYSFGFGYDCFADDYKVVRIDKVLSQGIYVFQTLIYSLKLDSWRVIKDFPCGSPWQIRATFLDGTLYWSSHNKTGVSLDLSTERFCQLSLPSAIHENRMCRMVGLDGHLFCCEFDYKINFFDVWVMEDNGVEKSLSRKFSLQLPVLDTPMKLWVVAYLKNKEQLILQYECGFLWCDIKSNYVKKFYVHDFPVIAYSQICPGSLVRFNFCPYGNFIGRALSKWKRKICPRILDHGSSVGRALWELKRKICSTSLVHSSSVVKALREWKRNKTNRDTGLIFCVEDVGEQC